MQQSLHALILGHGEQEQGPPSQPRPAIPSAGDEAILGRGRLAATAALCDVAWQSAVEFQAALSCFKQWTNTTRIAFEHSAEETDSSATDAFNDALARLSL
jgi:hypothetical protein